MTDPSMAIPTLQWGRDLEVAESNASPTRLRSTGRLQWGRDLEVAERLDHQIELCRLVELQWGRDLEVAESEASIGCAKGHYNELQWGRDLEVAESEKGSSGHR